MTESFNYRRERIERLLRELQYEVERGILEREIDEEMTFKFVVPISHKIPNGVVSCIFRTRPVTLASVAGQPIEPRLRLVSDNTG